MTPTSIDSDDALAGFRACWEGSHILRALPEHGGSMLINWPVGVGKSLNMDNVVAVAVSEGAYDLVVVLCPTRLTLAERQWVVAPPTHVRTAVIDRRPSHTCGLDRDARWRVLEARGCSSLGRSEICGTCPHRAGCLWPDQYGASLRGVRVIYATQSHLRRDPHFINHLKQWTQTEQVLVILDEDAIVLTSYRRRIQADELDRYLQAMRSVTEPSKVVGRWIATCSLLRATTGNSSLRSGDWRLPPLSPAQAVEVQRVGLSRDPESFRYLGHDLTAFCSSPRASREWHPNGDISYASPPTVSGDLILYSGTAVPEFCEFRLGVKLGNPFESYRFSHRGTRWFNIANRAGARCHFRRNADQILDFFAGLVARCLRENKRPLLVSKKCFIDLCADGMSERFRKMGLPMSIVTKDWSPGVLAQEDTLPLISYGMTGTNLFEDFDAAYCLNSFNVSEDIVNTVVQDVLGSDSHIPIRILTEGRPLRRRVEVARSDDRFTDIPQLANLALQSQEIDTVIQAIGRVRPFTKPREVITFQAGEHPRTPYTREFFSLGEAREFFEIPTARKTRAANTCNKVQAAKATGVSQSAAAKSLALSLSTVKRYWSGVTKPNR